jgi:hypothetical protein
MSVGELKNLRFLCADKDTILKGKIEKLTRLEELQLYSVEKCPNFFMELGKLANLRVLKIKYKECEETAGMDLSLALCNLHKIQSLIILSTGITEVVDLFQTKLAHVRVSSLESLAPSSRLRHFCLHRIFIPRMPSWIDSLCVPLLCELWLHVEVVVARDLQALGRLPSLLQLGIISKEEKSMSYTFRSGEFQKLECLVTNIEITLGEGALMRLETLIYSASAGIKDNLVPWNNSCPLLVEVICRVDCANSGRNELNGMKEVLRKAERTHPNAEDLDLQIRIENYNRKSARLIDALALILPCLDRPDGAKITADQRELRRMITSLETLLCDAAKPRVGRYGEQDLRGFVTKFKTLLHDVAGTDQEEVRACTTPSYLSIAVHIYHVTNW